MDATKAFIFANEANEDDHSVYSWVYVKDDDCIEETLAVELMEYTAYAAGHGKRAKRIYLKPDLIEMPKELFDKWEEYNMNGDTDFMEEIVNGLIDAKLVADSLK
ncbi:gp529 [Bacillus phage G]|uniref:Gp529 n=1 Tax=Bacillus phage G TaxID=2884420 RepID=G3MAS0_9CAUD|nr:gp529 [Bacillus phage G]AEO93787.1 gp529 [Bacillus phage G]